MKEKTLFLFSLALLIFGACSPQAFPPPDPTAAPTFTPDEGPDFSARTLTLVSESFSETGAGPAYSITAQIPQLQGSDDPRVAGFNARMKALVMGEIDRFRADVLANQPVEKIVAGSSLDVSYSLVSQRGDIWSLKFNLYSYFDGAAHPFSYSITSNYDVLRGGELTLDELFIPSENYLQFIAEICKAELAKRDIGFTDPAFQSGADPLPENYRNWNLADDGFLITFDPYQVAPYAAGPQQVTIPYETLRPVSNLNGALQLYDR